jgi:class 3 adenylate cyclase/pimeloyl-ACP methyl ester carboxylesterase
VEAPETNYAEVGGSQVAYQVLGDGPIDLVYHHGFCHLDLQWDVRPEAAWNRRLASFSRLILFDRRGSGASERLPRGHFPSPEEWCEDLLSVLDAVGTESVALFAEVEAGPMALLFAAAHPERVSALVLGNTDARTAFAEDYPQGVATDLIDSWVDLYEQLWGSTDLVRIGFPDLEGDEDTVNALARLVRAAATPRIAAAQFRHILGNLDARKALASIRCPTLVLRNDFTGLGGDPEKPLQRARYLADHLPNSEFSKVYGSNYLFFADDFEPVIEQVAEFLTGEPPPPEHDHMVATLLFTDIVSSTEHLASIGDETWKSLLDAHESEVAREIRRFGGRQINTTGDGFIVSFDAPSQAIRCAQKLTQDAEQHGIRIRAGIHTGECERRGNDVAGLAVNIAARVSALAGAGQVLVTRTVNDLVAGSDLQLHPHGTHQLKGVPGDWPLFSATTD